MLPCRALLTFRCPRRQSQQLLELGLQLIKLVTFHPLQLLGGQGRPHDLQARPLTGLTDPTDFG